MNAPPGSIGRAPVPAGAPAAMMAGRGALRPPPPPMHMGHPPMPQANPYYNATWPGAGNIEKYRDFINFNRQTCEIT